MTVNSNPQFINNQTGTRFHIGWWLLLIAALLAAQINPWWQPSKDAVNYLSIARNLSAGHLQRLGSPHLYYAPGYPLFIAPAFWFSSRPFLLLSIVHWALAVAFMLIVFLWASRYVRPLVALLLAGLAVMNASYWHQMNMTLSETLFTGAFCAGALAFNRLLMTRGASKTFFWIIATTLFITIAAMTRQAGILIVAGGGASILIRALRGKLSWTRGIGLGVAISLVPLIALAGLISYDRTMARTDPYRSTYSNQVFDPAQPITKQISLGIHRQITHLGQIVVPGMVGAYAQNWYEPHSRTKIDLNMIVYLPVAAGIALGWWYFVSQTSDVLALTVPFYLALYIVWPFDQGTRFLMPLAPVWFMSIWWLINRWTQSPKLLLILLIAHSCFALGYFLRELPSIRAYNQHWTDDERMVQCITHDKSSVGVPSKMNENRRLCLQYLLDRPIRIQSPDNQDFAWLIEQRFSPTPGDYRLDCQAGNLALYERISRQRS